VSKVNRLSGLKFSQNVERRPAGAQPRLRNDVDKRLDRALDGDKVRHGLEQKVAGAFAAVIFMTSSSMLRMCSAFT